MRIRNLLDHPDYLGQTAELLFSEWSHLPSWADEQQIRARLIARNSADNRQFTLVAVDAENTVTAAGSLIRYELDDHPQRIHWLGEIITHPAHRGQGTGTALVERIIALATERNITELWLYTPDKQALYRRLGWEDREQRVVAGESVTLMVSTLPAPCP